MNETIPEYAAWQRLVLSKMNHGKWYMAKEIDAGYDLLMDLYSMNYVDIGRGALGGPPLFCITEFGHLFLEQSK